MNSENIHAVWVNLWAVFMYFYTNIHALLNFECTKGDRRYGQGLATEVTNLRPPIFSP